MASQVCVYSLSEALTVLREFGFRQGSSTKALRSFWPWEGLATHTPAAAELAAQAADVASAARYFEVTLSLLLTLSVNSCPAFVVIQ